MASSPKKRNEKQRQQHTYIYYKKNTYNKKQQHIVQREIPQKKLTSILLAPFLNCQVSSSLATSPLPLDVDVFGSHRGGLLRSGRRWKWQFGDLAKGFGSLGRCLRGPSWVKICFCLAATSWGRGPLFFFRLMLLTSYFVFLTNIWYLHLICKCRIELPDQYRGFYHEKKIGGSSVTM